MWTTQKGQHSFCQEEALAYSSVEFSKAVRVVYLV